MDGIKDWQAHHRAYLPKLKVLRARWIAAKREIDNWKKLPRVLPDDPKSDFPLKVQIWITSLQLRNILTSRFNDAAMWRDITLDRILKGIVADVMAEGVIAEEQTLRCSIRTCQRLDDMIKEQEEAERAIVKGFQQLMALANTMTQALDDLPFRKWAERIGTTLEVVRDAELWLVDSTDRQQELEPHWRYLDTERLSLLSYGQVDRKDKWLMALIASFDVHIPQRQRVLWEYDAGWDGAWMACVVQTKSMERLIRELRQKAAMINNSKGVKGRYKKHNPLTSFFAVVERRDSNFASSARKVVKVKDDEADGTGLARQTTLDNFLALHKR